MLKTIITYLVAAAVSIFFLFGSIDCSKKTMNSLKKAATSAQKKVAKATGDDSKDKKEDKKDKKKKKKKKKR